jgi:hypothetical protein
MRGPNRPQPVGPPSAYKTYQVTSPPDTHVVVVCEQVGCLAWRNGWDTVVDERTHLLTDPDAMYAEATRLGHEPSEAGAVLRELILLGVRQAEYIRSGQSGRSFRELRTEDGRTVFRFDSHQRCFAEHRSRAELYVVRDGDWRGNPRGTAPRQHVRAADWVEDFAGHQDRIKTAHERG